MLARACALVGALVARRLPRLRAELARRRRRAGRRADLALGRRRRSPAPLIVVTALLLERACRVGPTTLRPKAGEVPGPREAHGRRVAGPGGRTRPTLRYVFPHPRPGAAPPTVRTRGVACLLLPRGVLAVVGGAAQRLVAAAPVAAAAGVVLGTAATRITYTEVLQSRRDAARDRAELAQDYRALTAARTDEHALFVAAMTGTVLRQQATITRLEQRLVEAAARADRAPSSRAGDRACPPGRGGRRPARRPARGRRGARRPGHVARRRARAGASTYSSPSGGRQRASASTPEALVTRRSLIYHAAATAW